MISPRPYTNQQSSSSAALLRLGDRPLRVLFLNQFFHPDLAATAQIVSDLAEDLVSHGATVTAITGQVPYIGGSRYPRRGEHQGIDIHRVPATGFGRGSIAARMADYLSFYTLSAAQLALLPRQDVVISLSTPPLLNLLAAGQKKFSGGRTRFIYWVQDLYPEVAVRLGVLSQNSVTTQVLERLARVTLGQADAIVALGETMATRLLEKGAPADRLQVIHNWSDATSIGAIAPEKNWFLEKHQLRGKLVVQYSGNMGRGHEFDTLLDAAQKLKSSPDIIFLFIGDGAKRGEIERAAINLGQLRLLPYQKREDLPYSLGAASLAVVTMSDGLEGLIVPSKLYGALAARKPVLFIGPKASEVAQIVRTENLGGVFSHGDGQGVADFIAWIASRPDQAAAMGERGRQVYEQRFERKIATRRFAEICSAVCGVNGMPSQHWVA